MSYDRRCNFLIIIYSICLTVSLITEAIYGNAYILRAIITIIMQLLLMLCGICTHIDNIRGGQKVLATVLTQKQRFTLNQKPLTIYLLFTVTFLFLHFSLTGDLTGVLIECAPLPYVILSYVMYKHSHGKSRGVRTLCTIPYLGFVISYLILLFICKIHDILLLTVFIIEAITLISYFFSYFIELRRLTVHKN